MSKELADALDVETPPDVRERFDELMEQSEEIVSPNNTEEILEAVERGEPVTFEVDSWATLWAHWTPATPD